MSDKEKVLKEIFIDFVNNNEKDEYFKFDSKYIFSHKLWIWNNKLSLTRLLISTGINPDCVLTTKKGLYKKSNSFLINIMDELEAILGREKLNVNSMENSPKIIPPKTLRRKGKFILSDKYNFPLKKIKPGTLLAGLERTFNIKWDQILIKTKRGDVKRKVAKNSLNNIVENYLSFKKKYSINNYYEIDREFLSSNNYPLLRQIRKINFDENKKISQYAPLFKGLISLEYYIKHNKFPKKSFFQNINTEKEFKKYLTSQKQVFWSRYPEVIQDVLLNLYAKGSSIYGEENLEELEKKVLYKIRHWKGMNSKKLYEMFGINIDNLQKIKRIIDSKYTRKDIHNKLRELLKKTIDTGVNHLSKEYIIQNEKEFMLECFKIERIETNNWSEILKIYGLNGDLFIPDRLDVSNRGVKFEKLILDLFSENLNLINNKKKHLGQYDFWYKKKIKSCIPDFNFRDFIIDTKFSVGFRNNSFDHNQVNNQIKNYIKTGKEIFLLTFNQKEKTITYLNKNIKIINLKSLKAFLKSMFGITIKDEDIKYIFNEINSVKFYRKYI